MRSAAMRAKLLDARRMAVLALVLLVSLEVPARADELDAYLQRQREVYQIPAIVVGVVRAGELSDSRAIGLSNVELSVPASTRHIFEIGSISKQFTAYAILMLFEQGKLDLNAPVGRYLPELPPAWARPTLHQLLGHISGLPDFEEAFGYGVYRETPSDAEFQKRLLDLPIEFEPGKKWSYSNTNYWLLARVIEQASGQTYAQFMQERIFTPLGMNSTRTALPTQILMGRAAGYQLVEGRLENREAMQPSTGRGLGDIATTVEDMVCWDREQRAPRLIKPEIARLALEPVKLADGSPTGYGYGWFITPVLGLAARHHSGGTAGFVAEYLRFPDRDLAVVLFANRFGAPTSPGRVARLVDANISGPPLIAAAGFDVTQAGRVRELAAGAAKARSEWHEDWFAAEFWRSVKPYLLDVEEDYRRRGPLLVVTPVGPNGTQDVAKPSYRVVFEKMTRVMTFEFDKHGKIKSFQAEDE
ncbi:MAG: penicillin-binding protein [Burkholderiaceae bacterium]|nr:penicillin-binding protein [Burkholderiaceae bacterium]